MSYFFFFFQAEDGIRDIGVTGVQTCALPISWDVFLRHGAADDFIDEFEWRAGRRGLGDDLDLRELAGAAGLLLVLIIVLDALGDLLSERYLRRADIGVHFVGALEDVDLDVEMQFAHAADDGLARFRISVDAEGRVLRSLANAM